MKSRIILFLTIVFTVSSLSVVYGDEIGTLTSVKHATTISEANAVLHLALKDKRLKKALKNAAKNIYREAKRSDDPMFIYEAHRAYVKAQKQEKLAIAAYSQAIKVESVLRRNLKIRGKALSLSSSSLGKAQKYVDYTLSLEKQHESKKGFLGYIASFFNIDIEGEITLGQKTPLNDIHSQYAMMQSANGGKNNHVTIMARKTIVKW